MHAPELISGGLSEDDLKKLSTILIGDQLAKAQLFIPTQRHVFDELLKFGDELSVNHLKLDILNMALNLDQDVVTELGRLYHYVVDYIFEIKSLPQGLANGANDSATNYKYVKLVNLCRLKCRRIYPYLEMFEEGLIHLLQKCLGNSNQMATVDDKRCVVELLEHFLVISSSVERLGSEVLLLLENLLLRIAEKYALDINFKYVIRVKASKSSPASVKYNPLSNKGLELNSSIPNAVRIDNPLDKDLLSIGLVLYPSVYENCRGKKSSLWEEMHFNMIISSLLKSDSIFLKCSVLDFFLYPFFKKAEFWKQKQRLKQILPYLVESFNYDPLPWWFDPFDKLNGLIELYHRHEPLNNPVISFLSKTNVAYGLLTLFSQCLSLKYQNDSTLRSLTKFIRLCASLSAFEESYRSLLLEDKALIHHLVNGLESHLNLLKEFLLNKEQIRYLEGDTTYSLPPLYDSEITMAWLLLLKSFSRSVTALRTSLKRNRLAELLLDLLGTTYKSCKEGLFAGPAFLETEVGIMGITLGGICNFVVEFSYLQSFMLKNGIVEIIGQILTDPAFNPKQPWPNENLRCIFSDVFPDEVKTNALWVLRHLMYNCQNSEKLDLLNTIPMSTILEFINDSCWSVQEQCFQLIRNLTCNSRKVVNILLENFKNFEYEFDPKGGPVVTTVTVYLFEYLAHKMKLLNPADLVQRKTLEGILYILVNVAAVNENKKELVIEQDEILNILREILSESPQRVSRYGNDSKLKLASLWVLNNLLWNSTISRYTHYALEGYTPSQESDSRAVIHQNSSFWNSIGVDREAMIEMFRDDLHEQDMEQEDNDQNTSETSDNDDEFVHNSEATDSASALANKAAIQRCKKLVNMGMYDLVKQNIFDESLSVREKARTLLYHMDLLLKGTV